jgi:hypothetical protein
MAWENLAVEILCKYWVVEMLLVAAALVVVVAAEGLMSERVKTLHKHYALGQPYDYNHIVFNNQYC